MQAHHSFRTPRAFVHSAVFSSNLLRLACWFHCHVIRLLFFFFPYYPFTHLPHGIFSKHFGGGEESALLAGIVGHNLCIDRFGGPHSYMVQQGKLMKEKYEWKPVHGEVRN